MSVERTLASEVRMWGTTIGRATVAAAVAAMSWCHATALRAQESGALELRRLTGPIELDGRPDERAWSDVAPLPLTMYAPVFGGEPSERSEIRVAYDDDHLYAAGWFYDSDPGGIRVNSLYRDRWNGDDAFAVYVDAFNDNENAKWFGTTPSAMRFDLLVADDGATLNESWDTFWDAETTVTEEGWFAEVRIPFSSLGFQSAEDGTAVMGLTVTRLVSRTGERVTFPAIDPRYEFRQPSVARDVVLRDVSSPRPIYVTPYALTGMGREAVFESEAGAWASEREVPREVGFDVRYPLSGTLTLDVTANTDFAQVEADDEQVNLDRFSLFFPEKRRFFQERSGIFDFTTGGGSRVFHSRQIGLTQRREPVPVLGGARLVGRVGEWDVGFLDMQTEELGSTPTENFGVARLRRRVFNPYSTAGFLATSRFSEGRHNVVTGADASIRLFGDDYLTFKGVSSFDDAHGDTTSVVDRSHVYVSLDRARSRGLQYSMSLTRSGREYHPGLGFLPRRDYWAFNAYGNWFLFTDGHPFFRRVYPGALAFSAFRNGDGTLESGQYAVWVQWDTKAGGGGWIEPKLFVEDVLTPFSIDEGADVPAGRYTYADLQLVWSMPAGRRLRASVDARAGTFFDGTRQQVIFQPTWNVSPNLELGADYQFTRLRFDDRGQGADIHLARVRVRSALDARASGNAFVQYNSTTDRLDFNVRLRYNFSEGTDLWVVYNEGLATELLPDPSAPPVPRSMARTLILKYSYTWGA